MTSQTSSYIGKITAFIGSRGFFLGVIAILGLQAAWIALSGRYPMAFDESFHLGIIRLYSHHISPFWAGQPPGVDALGPISRDPSYLYHYLLSFPYRLINSLIGSQTAQVIVLRFINIGLFASCLPIYRRLLLKTGASKQIVQASLAVFVLIPIVPLLAAQINYDNLLLPLTGLSLLLAVNFSQELHKTRRLNIKLLLEFLIAGLAASLVKYAFLPIFLVIFAFLAICLKQSYTSWQELKSNIISGFRLLRGSLRWLLLVLLVVMSGLFAQRYAVNAIRYHKPVPDCAEVLSVQQCGAYGPWVRDHQLQINKPAEATSNPLVFTADWFYGMWLRSFFAVDGPGSNFQTRGPLILPGIGAIVLALAAVISSLVNAKRVLRRYDRQVVWLFVAAIAGYAAVLWLNGYQSFLQTGHAVAINGRYLLPIMPLLLLLLGVGVNELFRRRQTAKVIFVSVALLCMLWGGGSLTYILRSSDSWYWRNHAVHNANQAVQHVLGPVTPGYNRPTEFMGFN